MTYASALRLMGKKPAGGGGARYLLSYTSPNYDTQGVCRSTNFVRRVFNHTDYDGTDREALLASATSMTCVYTSDSSVAYDGPVNVTDPNYGGVAVDMTWTNSVDRGRDLEYFLITHVNGNPVA